MSDPQPIKQRIEADYDGKPLQDAARDVKQLETATEQSSQAAAKDGRAKESQRQELERLIREQREYNQIVQLGAKVSDQDAEASRVRSARIDELSREMAQQADVTDEASASIARYRDSSGQAGQITAMLAGQVAGMASGMVGVGGIVMAYREWIREIETANQYLQENARLTRENAEARLDFAALAGIEDPEQVRALDAAAAFAGRRPGEVARVAAVFKSQFPNASNDDIQSLITEVAAAGQLTGAPLQSLALPIAGLFRETGDARIAGNIFQESVTQAGQADPALLGQSIGRFIGVGQQIGGLTPAEAAGFAAAGTGLGLPDEIATTGLKNVLFAIRGRGTPEGAKVLEREGVDREDVQIAIQQIASAYQAGRITPAELESLGGREAAPVFAALTNEAKLGNFLVSVGSVVGAGEREGRIASDKAAGVFSEGSIQAFNLLAKQEESRAEAVRSGSPLIARQEAGRRILDRILAERIDDGSISPALAGRIRDEFNAQLAMGRSVEDAIAIAEEVPDTDYTFRSPLSGTLDSYSPLNLQGGLGAAGRNRGRQNIIEAPFLESMNAGPDINVTVNNGTMINHGRNPETADISDGRATP